MTTLIVNASSKSKRENTDLKFKYTDKPFHSRLSKSNQKAILKARNYVLSEMEMEHGPDIESNVNLNDSDFLPAYLRYSGRTYSKITNDAWDSLLSSKNKMDMVILSACYGLLRYNEPVRNYGIKQVTKMPTSTIGNHWKKSGAKTWLLDYIESNKIDDVKFVLSVSYSKIIEKEDLITALKEKGIDAEAIITTAPGMGSMLERGTFIDNFMLNY